MYLVICNGKDNEYDNSKPGFSQKPMVCFIFDPAGSYTKNVNDLVLFFDVPLTNA